jgi:hypothetical protein
VLEFLQHAFYSFPSHTLCFMVTCTDATQQVRLHTPLKTYRLRLLLSCGAGTRGLIGVWPWLLWAYQSVAKHRHPVPRSSRREHSIPGWVILSLWLLWLCQQSLLYRVLPYRLAFAASLVCTTAAPAIFIINATLKGKA